MLSLQAEMNENVRKELFRKLKKENCFWSYDMSKMKTISDELLIEYVFLYLDIDDINLLFKIFPYKKVKKAWIENVVAQGEMYYVLNKFFALCAQQVLCLVLLPRQETRCVRQSHGYSSDE